jgi:CMP-N,N'-diacetyllegionaminic acid synthase
MFILGVIPARAGSKGIENKNIYPLCGKPLIEWTFEEVIKSRLSASIISSNDERIKEISDYKNFYWLRPNNLCENNTKMIDVIKYVVHQFESHKDKHVDAVMILQPTSPLRTKEDINKAIQLFQSFQFDGKYDSLYSGYYMGIKTKEPYDKHTAKPHFQRNGAIFITRRDLLDQGKLWSDNVIEFEMPKSRSIDIDDMDDMYMAESLIKNGVLGR